MGNEKYIVQLEAPPAIVKPDQRRSDQVQKRLQQLETNTVLCEFEQADLWAETKKEGYFYDWGYGSFKDYLKQTGVELSAREVDYRVTISNVRKALGIDLTKVQKARISKMKQITRLSVTGSVIDETTGKEEQFSDIIVGLVETAPSRSLKEIKEVVDRLLKKPDEETDVDAELTWLNLPVRRDAKKIVIDAIERVIAMAGSTIDTMTKEEKDMSMAAGLEKVAADFLADPNNQLDEFDGDDEEPAFEDSVEDDEDFEDDGDDEE